MRVCLVGGEDVSARLPLARAMLRHGWTVSIAGSEASERFREPEIGYLRYALEREMSPLADLATIRELARMFRRHAFDVVHAFDTKPCMYVPLASHASPQTVVSRTITGVGRTFSDGAESGAVRRALYRLLHFAVRGRVDLTVFQNRDDRKRFLEWRLVPAGRTAIVPGSGVDRRRFDPTDRSERRRRTRCALRIPESSIVFVMVSRIVREKGVDDYVKCAATCSARDGAPVFLLVGPAEGDATIVREIESARAVRWLGPRDDVPDLLTAADVFVLPTAYGEGIPRSLLEGACSGLALVATDVAGCRDVIEHGRNGLLVPPRDAAALSDACLMLLDDAGLRGRLGRNARLGSERYGEERVFAELIAQLERVARR